MDTDKNKNLLEKQLKAIGKKVRVDILKKLSNSQVPLTFSTLQKEILENTSNSTNFSFHLNTLKKNKLIENIEDGYVLTVLGRQILRNILSIEQILNAQNKSIMIRTSKYSKEPFDLRKIEEYLVKEGAMERYQSKQIAQEVEERLSKTKIEYLTAPLMREYINGVLLENGLEKVRHRLTRLGTPPSEVSQYFSNSNLNPELFIKSLGSEVSEQYLLLNLLPNDLADLYLSGEIYLLHLNYWSLRPLSLYINTPNLLEFMVNNHAIDRHNSRSSSYLILELLNSLREIKPFYSEDLLLGNFDILLEYLNSTSEDYINNYQNLISKLSQFDSFYLDEHAHLTLNINEVSNEFFHEISDILKKERYLSFPNFMIDYSNSLDITGEILNSKLLSNLRFFNNKESKLMNSTLNYIHFPFNNNKKDNKILLDKILINLHTLALKSHQEDDVLLELVQNRVRDVFEFFSLKQKLIKKKLHSSKPWNQLITTYFNHDEKDWIQKSIKAISFFGLNNAIKHHCGIEIDRIDRSEKFALVLLDLIKDVISEKNSDENELFYLSQPHEGSYLYQTKKNSSYENESFSMDLIRKESRLSLDQKLELFKKFENLLNGGCIFNYYINPNQKNLRENIEKIKNSKISAFSLKFI